MYYQDHHVTLYNSSCFGMKEIPDNSIQCVVTSPPYWGLRKYDGHDNVFGLEPTIEGYVEHSIQVLREIKRVLRPDGVCFWNIGDSYAGGGNGAANYPNSSTAKQNSKAGTLGLVGRSHVVPAGVKAKDLCLIPFRVALAAQADGWWVRSDIIWNKPNPMPESVTDRPTDAYEHIFMFTKSAKYYWDIEAVREPAESWGTRDRSNMRNGTDDPLLKHHGLENDTNPAGRNIRNVWTSPTQPYKGAHFATFPEELPERCIKAATPETGCCSKCGKPWERLTESNNANRTRSQGVGQDTLVGTKGRAGELETKTIGWEPACKCDVPSVPSVVLDPFGGSGTTAWVAKRLNRKCILYEMSKKYCDLIIKRNMQQVGL